MSELCPSCLFVGPDGDYAKHHVEGDANCQVISALRRRDTELWKEAQGKLDARKAQVSSMRREISALRAELTRTLPLVEAVTTYIETANQLGLDRGDLNSAPNLQRIVAAGDAYLATPSKLPKGRVLLGGWEPEEGA